MLLYQESTKTSFRAEREFGLVVGGVLILLGSWWLYKNSWPMVASAALGIGAILVISGLILPKILVIPNRLWMKLAMLLSLITTPIILGLVYFLILMPIGVGKRILGWDPLRRRAPSAGSYWVSYNDRQRNPKHFEKMY